MDKQRLTSCPTCGSSVHQTVGDNTNHFIPINLDQEVEKKAVAFGIWLKKTVFDGDVPDLYQYFLEKVYKK